VTVGTCLGPGILREPVTSESSVGNHVDRYDDRTEKSNRLTNVNGISESFPNVNAFRMLMFGCLYLDRGPAPIW